MPQEVYYVNCPHGGHIVEVVCPRPNRKVEKVEAIGSGLRALVLNSMRCPKCGERMFLDWTYK